jgi:hypothetical protein
LSGISCRKRIKFGFSELLIEESGLSSIFIFIGTAVTGRRGCNRFAEKLPNLRHHALETDPASWSGPTHKGRRSNLIRPIRYC